MIGVLAESSVHDVVREFFELFKTPWEFVRERCSYSVVISDGSSNVNLYAAPVVLLYAGASLPQDSSPGRLIQRTKWHQLAHEDLILPIFGNCVLFPGKKSDVLIEALSRQSALYAENRNGKAIVRVGYDLFAEIRILLDSGQPAGVASIPSMEIHISLLRKLILMQGIPLPEIPPVPAGYNFVACLTHDVDHPSIRRHKCDHTILGFLYRAIVRSAIDVARNRCGIRKLLRNWWAVCKLPFVYWRLTGDFWLQFDRYLELEVGHPSTFFVIPFKDRPGRRGNKSAPARRAARYNLADIERPLRRLSCAGCEIGLHGLDAWHDISQGREELKRVGRVAGRYACGVRMHWLYFDRQSSSTLEKAGADYDSTVGFNETIGYRAGTTQVYKPFDAAQLLELPLHIMDTALFYPGYMNLSSEKAIERVRRIIENAVRFGGCVTINWHDRSISPERCWDGFYSQVIHELERNGAWFATASQAVSWFRKRREAACHEIGVRNDREYEVVAKGDDTLPRLQCRTHGLQIDRESFAH